MIFPFCMFLCNKKINVFFNKVTHRKQELGPYRKPVTHRQETYASF